MLLTTALEEESTNPAPPHNDLGFEDWVITDDENRPDDQNPLAYRSRAENSQSARQLTAPTNAEIETRLKFVKQRAWSRVNIFVGQWHYRDHWVLRRSELIKYGLTPLYEIRRYTDSTPNPLFSKYFMCLSDEDPEVFVVFYHFVKHGKVNAIGKRASSISESDIEFNPIPLFLRLWVFLNKLDSAQVAELQRQAFSEAYQYYAKDNYILMCVHNPGALHSAISQ